MLVYEGKDNSLIVFFSSLLENEVTSLVFVLKVVTICIETCLSVTYVGEVTTNGYSVLYLPDVKNMAGTMRG